MYCPSNGQPLARVDEIEGGERVGESLWEAQGGKTMIRKRGIAVRVAKGGEGSKKINREKECQKLRREQRSGRGEGGRKSQEREEPMTLRNERGKGKQMGYHELFR